VEADVERTPRHVAVAGEAVEHAADVVCRFLGQQREGVVLRFACVDDDRKPPPSCS
jgi:hypothetical protein